MSDEAINETKLKTLLSIENRNHTPEQRTSMIVQGVNWLGLLQGILILFIHKMPAALFSMLLAIPHSQRESK